MPISTERAVPRLGGRGSKERPGHEIVADVFQILADPLVTLLARYRVSPPAVVLVHAAIGLLAALAIGTEALLAGALLLQLKTLLDNADGQLARRFGQVTAIGRYLDTEADFVVNASVLAALAVVTGMPVLAAAAFVGLTLVLSVDHNVAALYDEAHGGAVGTAPVVGSTLERALAGSYAVVFAPQDRLVRTLSSRRLARVLGDEFDGARRARATLAYHDRATVIILANLGLSTQLLVLGVCLAVGASAVYLWLVLGSVGLLPILQLRRERLARRGLAA